MQSKETERLKTKEKKRLSKKAIVTRLGGALLALAALGTATKHHIDFEVPMTPQGIVSDFTGIPTEVEYTIRLWQHNKEVNEEFKQPVPSVFDNKQPMIAQAGINAQPITENQLNDFFRNNTNPIDKESKNLPKVTALLPLRLENEDKILISTPHIPQAFNPLTWKIEPIDAGKEITVQRIGTEIDILNILGLKSNEAEVFQLEPLSVENKDYFSGEVIRFKGEDGSIWLIYIRAKNDVRDLEALDILKDAPILDIKNENDLKMKEGKIIKNGVTMKTTNENATIQINARVYLSGQSDFLPVSFDFTTNNEKLLYKTPTQP